MSIFNIALNLDFTATLSEWLLENFTSEVAQVKIFLPSRRSCLELKKNIALRLKEKNITTAFLPTIKAIGDISYEDLLDVLGKNDDEFFHQKISEIISLNQIDGLKQILFLAAQIQQLEHFRNPDYDHSIAIATHFQKLFGELEKNTVALENIDEIDDSNMALHKQITVEFIRNFYHKTKNTLIKNNLIFAEAYHNLLVDNLIELISEFNLSQPLIIAGSTGSINSTRRLIGEVAKQSKGYVVLHGFYDHFTFDSNQVTCQLPQQHPQFLLHQLILENEIAAKEIQQIDYQKFLLAPQARVNMILQAMLPASEIYKWQQQNKIIADEALAVDIQKNWRLINARNELAESKAIAEILSSANAANKRVAVIANNAQLFDLLESELQQLQLGYNRAAALPLLNCELIKFIHLIIAAIESDFDSHNLLALFKHKFFFKGNFDLNKFEINIIRQERKTLGLEGILQKIIPASEEEIFFKNFLENVAPIKNLQQKISLASYVKNLLLVIEKIATQKFDELLQQEAAQQELQLAFADFLMADLLVDAKNFLPTFNRLIAQINYFRQQNLDADIQLLSTIEARLLHFDLVIIAALNDDEFLPKETADWLGKKIKKDLEIDDNQQRIGQVAHDFCQHLCTKEVVFTRSLTRLGEAKMAAVFLQKILILTQKLGISISQQSYPAETTSGSNEIIFKPKIPQIAPHLRPRSFAITDIGKLMSDPYAIYVKRVLNLTELPQIDYEAANAEFGSFVHKILEEAVKNNLTFDDCVKLAQQLFGKYFLQEEAQIIWLPKFKNILQDFIATDAQFCALQNYCEVPVELEMEGILIRGKIDRIVIDQGNVDVYDYKTGAIPDKKLIIVAVEPQLIMAALMLIDGKVGANLSNFSVEQINSLNYWKLSQSKQRGEIKKIFVKENLKSYDLQIEMAVAAARIGVKELISQYFPKNLCKNQNS